MILVGALAELHALEQLLGDVRVPCRGHQRGEPIEAGEDSVLDGAWLDLPLPADNGGGGGGGLPPRTPGGFLRRASPGRARGEPAAAVRRGGAARCTWPS